MQRAHCLPPAQGSVWAVRPQHVTASRHKRKALHILEVIPPFRATMGSTTSPRICLKVSSRRCTAHLVGIMRSVWPACSAQPPAARNTSSALISAPPIQPLRCAPAMPCPALPCPPRPVSRAVGGSQSGSFQNVSRATWQAVQNGEPRIISNAGRRTTPSVVAFQPDGQVLVGVPAQR